MKLRVGYELQYEFPQPTPIIATLNIHFTRVSDLATPDHIVVSPSAPISGYRDMFGNWCSRLVAPAGSMLISTDFIVEIPAYQIPSCRTLDRFLSKSFRKRPSSFF